jgi:hypothetical protein
MTVSHTLRGPHIVDLSLAFPDIFELNIAEEELRATYMFDVNKGSYSQLRNAVAFAQHQLYEELANGDEFNVFLLEGWAFTCGHHEHI